MRLHPEKISCLKQAIAQVLPSASVFLFGSRVDDQKKGGDIDVLILGDRELDYRQKAQIEKTFFSKFGEQKLDLVSFLTASQDPFKTFVLKSSVKL